MISTIIMAATIAANAFITAKVVQEPTFDFKFAVPQSGSEVAPALPLTSASAQDIVVQTKSNQDPIVIQAQGNQDQIVEPRINYRIFTSPPATISLPSAADSKLVSVSFHGTKAGDVLSWMERQGVSFIVNDDLLKSKTITMNIVNQPLNSTIDSISAALGGHWTTRGSIRVFEPGLERLGSFSSSLSGLPSFGTKTITTDTVRSSMDPKSRTLFSFQDGAARGAQGFGAKTLDLSHFVDSLTPKQKEISKSKGYLSKSDLSQAQIDMLGLNQMGTMELQFNVNGEKYRIKSP